MRLVEFTKVAERAIHLIGRGFALYISLIFCAAFAYALWLLALDIIGY